MKPTATEKSHARFSPSAASRWLVCPGSIAASDGLTGAESAAALEGTRAHSCVEALLKAGPHKRLTTEAFLKKSYPIEMVLHAAAAAKEIWTMVPNGASVAA